MFWYTLFLLISITFKSFGMPVSQSNGTVHLDSFLSILANHCDNSFLSNQIKSKIQDCSLTVSHDVEQKEFLCLIFYDINSQLCAAVNSNGLMLNEDYTVKINKEQNVNDVCDVAKNWRAMNKTEYGSIKNTMDHIFKESFMCIKVCGSPTLDSADTNFYCKYYKWGWEMLNSQTNTLPAQENKIVAQAAPLHTDANNDKKVGTTSQHTITPTKAAGNLIVGDQSKINESNPNKSTLPKMEKVEQLIQKPIPLSKISNSETGAQQLNTQVSNTNDIPNLEKNVEKIENNDIKFPIEASDGNPSENNEDEKPILAEDTIEKKDEPVKDNQFDKQVNEQKEPVIDNPKMKAQNGDTDDYSESDDVKEALTDMHDDDGGDPMPSDLDTKMDQEQNKNSIKKIETPMSNFGEAQKEYNPIQEGFADDDDHFFPFFLTAVILVVLLYVLYHNKNKVSKVFFGLLLEGRQPGRRRNSRGHAYRRLDTLEQAMSTNTAAPPSKIIY